MHCLYRYDMVGQIVPGLLKIFYCNLKMIFGLVGIREERMRREKEGVMREVAGNFVPENFRSRERALIFSYLLLLLKNLTAATHINIHYR